MSKRKQISKKTRFEVFKRDSFSCQYCGSKSPDVVLHVDHINPVANGGDNDMDNLITSCEPCNLGKSARLLSDIPQSLKDKAENALNEEIKILEYQKVVEGIRERVEENAWDVVDILEGKETDSFNKRNLMSIRRFIESLPLDDVLEAAEIAYTKYHYNKKTEFRYFCGICWRKIREEDNG